jgi:hypothetical protein
MKQVTVTVTIHVGVPDDEEFALDPSMAIGEFIDTWLGDNEVSGLNVIDHDVEIGDVQVA